MDSIRKQARIAGLLYALVGATAPVGLIYVPGKLFVTGDATATADHYIGALGDIADILELGEPPIILWLLIWGAKRSQGTPSSPEPA